MLDFFIDGECKQLLRRNHFKKNKIRYICGEIDDNYYPSYKQHVLPNVKHILCLLLLLCSTNNVYAKRCMHVCVFVCACVLMCVLRVSVMERLKILSVVFTL